MIDGVVGAARELCLVAAERDWAGPDIYDGLAARWPRPLTSGPRRRQAIIQLHARAPIDLRPLSRREHRPIAKAARAVRTGGAEACRARGRPEGTAPRPPVRWTWSTPISERVVRPGDIRGTCRRGGVITWPGVPT